MRAVEQCGYPASVVEPSDRDQTGTNAGEPNGRKPLRTVQPVPVDPAPIVWAGTAIWFVGFIVLLPMWSWLGHHDHRIWLWTCLAGGLLGLLGTVLLGRHRRAGRVASA
jgi:hypothetical protein